MQEILKLSAIRLNSLRIFLLAATPPTKEIDFTSWLFNARLTFWINASTNAFWNEAEMLFKSDSGIFASPKFFWTYRRTEVFNPLNEKLYSSFSSAIGNFIECSSPFDAHYSLYIFQLLPNPNMNVQVQV